MKTLKTMLFCIIILMMVASCTTQKHKKSTSWHAPERQNYSKSTGSDITIGRSFESKNPPKQKMLCRNGKKTCATTKHQVKGGKQKCAKTGKKQEIKHNYRPDLGTSETPSKKF